MCTQPPLLQRHGVHVNAWCGRSDVSDAFPKLQSAGDALARVKHCMRLICCMHVCGWTQHAHRRCCWPQVCLLPLAHSCLRKNIPPGLHNEKHTFSLDTTQPTHRCCNVTTTTPTFHVSCFSTPPSDSTRHTTTPSAWWLHTSPPPSQPTPQPPQQKHTCNAMVYSG